MALECSGSVTVTNQTELNSYANDLGLKKGKIKNLNIAFSPNLNSELVIATPCSIKISDNIYLSSSANICLHGETGVTVGENFKFNGKNLTLESRDEVIVKINSEITGQDISLFSNGSGDSSKAHLRDGAVVNAANLMIESHDKGSIGQNSNITLSDTLGIYTLGDDEASIRVGSTISAKKVEVSSTEETRVAKNTTINAEEVILNGAICTVDKTALINSTNRIGNCFLGSVGKAGFSIDKNQGTNPLTVNFNASSLASEAKGFVWAFGDGETVNTTLPSVSHTYTRVGSYSATLKYATKENFKGLKSGGFVQIDVKAPVVSPTTPPRGTFNYAQEETFVYLKGFIRKTQFDIANAYYVIDDNQNNKIPMSNFYQNSQTTVEMNTYGQHKITMYVEDTQGQKYNTSMMIDLKENEDEIAPIVRFYGEQSAPRTAFINMASSFTPIPDLFLKDFKIDFGDGQSAEVHDATSIVHTYAVAGTYNVKVTADYNGNERFAIVPVTVTDENKAALRPVAAFDYHQFDFAGNVTLNDDRSGTPNGEIISYIWTFPDGSQVYGPRVSHFFEPGNHLVSLTVVDTAGLTSTSTQMIYVALAGDDIVSALECWNDGDKKIACDVFALDKLNEITRVRVQWGDGTSVNLTGQAEIAEWGLYFAEHVYQNYGTYNLRLTVDTVRGQTKYAYASETFSFQGPEVNYPPVASLQCFSSDMLVTCNTFGSYDPEGRNLNYTIDWGNGIVEQFTSPTMIRSFELPGYYNITLTVTDDRGLFSKAMTSLQILPPEPPNINPVARLSCFSNNPLTISCDLSGSSDEDGYIVSYEIDFDGVTTVSTAQGFLSYSFTSPGEKKIILKVTDNDGGTNSIFGVYTVNSNTNPIVESLDCVSSKPYQLSCFANAIENDTGDMIVGYRWDMGDNKEKIDSLIPSIGNYIYSEAGEKTISITVYDQYGGETTIEKKFIVKENRPPLAQIICNLSGNSTYACDAGGSTDTDGQVTEYLWTIEGVQLTGKNILYTFTDGGQKTINLRVVDDMGLEGSAIENVSIDKPQVSFNCINSGVLKISCTSTSDAVAGNIVYHRFEFDDQDFQDGSSVEFNFESSGLHKVRLVELNNRLKEGYSEKWINVVGGVLPPKAQFNVGYDFDKKVKFNAIESQLQGRKIASYEWTFGDSESIATAEFKTEHSYQSFGAYQVKLKVIDQEGQSDIFEKEIFVHNPEVEDPGEEGHETILGIDSDEDGVRDDVQRWLNYEAKGDENIRIILKKLARNWQENIKEINDGVKSKELILKRNLIEACLEGTLNDPVRTTHLKQMMEYIHFYKEIRFFIKEKNNENYAGLVFDRSRDTIEKKLITCQEI
ncbi:PKD domain-containing protein [Bacteriovorax stolpii]|uniref:PKD domain-containing protein n=1 Tax=Bacteriovorax stolpii TaxID=960 RepID=UPI00163C51D0|nr:PKD domain-containing protein [Bacteriovorax stolpii]